MWDEAEIDARAKRLAERAAEVWIFRSLDDDVLDRYRPKTTRVESVYTLADHPYLAEGTGTRNLFDALTAEVLALDPVVTEEILKLYIAFKAETNFVDVVPQASRLRLSLNMQFHELNDPREFATDVTDVGRWGNGDVEVGFSDLADLSYVMGLIRQSFEKQMGNGQDVA